MHGLLTIIRLTDNQHVWDDECRSWAIAICEDGKERYIFEEAHISCYSQRFAYVDSQRFVHMEHEYPATVDNPQKEQPDSFLDDDGYPTRAALHKIATWPYNGGKVIRGVLNFIKSIWYHSDIAWDETEAGRVKISTVGWSGNEDLIGAMRKNRAFWSFAFENEHVGGHFTFRLDKTVKLSTCAYCGKS
jgi:hypothetical protein